MDNTLADEGCPTHPLEGQRMPWLGIVVVALGTTAAERDAAGTGQTLALACECVVMAVARTALEAAVGDPHLWGSYLTSGRDTAGRDSMMVWSPPLSSGGRVPPSCRCAGDAPCQGAATPHWRSHSWISGQHLLCCLLHVCPSLQPHVYQPGHPPHVLLLCHAGCPGPAFEGIQVHAPPWTFPPPWNPHGP